MALMKHPDLISTNGLLIRDRRMGNKSELARATLRQSVIVYIEGLLALLGLPCHPTLQVTLGPVVEAVGER